VPAHLQVGRVVRRAQGVRGGDHVAIRQLPRAGASALRKEGPLRLQHRLANRFHLGKDLLKNVSIPQSKVCPPTCWAAPRSPRS
jgi:hypothetical protein